MNDDKINSILQQAIDNNIGCAITPLISNGKIIAKRILCMENKENWRLSIFKKYNYLKKYEKCYHGTYFNNLISILKYGFLKPGSILPEGKKITVNSNHF